jgi:zinc transporter
MDTTHQNDPDAREPSKPSRDGDGPSSAEQSSPAAALPNDFVRDASLGGVPWAVMAFELDGRGGIAQSGREVVERWRKPRGQASGEAVDAGGSGGADAVRWLHVDRSAEGAAAWFAEASGIEPWAAGPLLDETVRPRRVVRGEELLLVLRGVNLNAGADPQQSIALRLWSDGRRVVTVRSARMASVRDVRKAFEAGHGPRDAGGMVVQLTRNLANKPEAIIHELADALDVLEERIAADRAGRDTVRALAEIRRRAAELRRFLGPQRDVVQSLAHDGVPWLSDAHRIALLESADRFARRVEEVDMLREACVVAREEYSDRIVGKQNQRLYVLAIITTVFLPLSLGAGLLGMNVGGVPWSDRPWGFWAVFIAMGGLGVALLLVLRARRWF